MSYDLFLPGAAEKISIPQEYCGNRETLAKRILSIACGVCERLGLDLTAVVCEYVNNHCRVIIRNLQGRRIVGIGNCFEAAALSAEVSELIEIGVQPEDDEYF